MDQEKINKIVAQHNKQKGYLKKYHMSERGKQKRREAAKRYYAKKKAEKLISQPNINAVSS